MTAWAALLLAGVGCFGLRFGVLAAVDRWSMPAWVDRAAGFVMPASFAALCSISLLGAGTGGIEPALLVAGTVTALVAVRRSPSVAVLCGMVALWGWDVAATMR